jgi:hypothetical protein
MYTRFGELISAQGVGVGSQQGTITNRSGTIAVGATAQSLMAANPARRYFMLQNLDPSVSLWVRIGATAVQSQPSTELKPGAVLVQEDNFISSESVSVIGPSTGQAFSSWEG